LALFFGLSEKRFGASEASFSAVLTPNGAHDFGLLRPIEANAFLRHPLGERLD
jgi:hypothetical protein